MASFQTAGYPVPPPGFMGYDYRSSPQAPPYASGQYYSPRYSTQTSTPSKGHARRATGDGAFFYPSSTNTPPRRTYTYTTPEHAYYSSTQTKSARKPDYVSNSERVHESARYDRASADKYGASASHSRHYSSYEPHQSSRPRFGEDTFNGRSDEYLPRYEQYESRPPPYNRFKSYRESSTDHYYYDQERIYTPAEESAHQPRPRRASYTAQDHRKPTQPKPQAQRPRTATKEKREATEADAIRHNIPAGFSIKFWDPNEEPILLLGSVFDADSLGKWIYDWSAFFYGAASPLAEEAGDLWVLLINLSHKIKLAEEIMGRVRSTASRDLLEEFLDSGERIWQRFSKLLKICESYMWKVAKQESGSAKKVTMGKNSGLAFVEAMFDRDCELRTTEKLMQHIRTWLVRYDANCLPILKDPSH